MSAGHNNNCAGKMLKSAGVNIYILQFVRRLLGAKQYISYKFMYIYISLKVLFKHNDAHIVAIVIFYDGAIYLKPSQGGRFYY